MAVLTKTGRKFFSPGITISREATQGMRLLDIYDGIRKEVPYTRKEPAIKDKPRTMNLIRL